MNNEAMESYKFTFNDLEKKKNMKNIKYIDNERFHRKIFPFCIIIKK